MTVVVGGPSLSSPPPYTTPWDSTRFCGCSPTPGVCQGTFQLTQSFHGSLGPSRRPSCPTPTDRSTSPC
jgi:hypothetical protein